MKKSKKETRSGMKDTENHQGLLTNRDYLELISNNKAIKSFERKEAKSKQPSRIDSFLTRLYFAL